MFVIYHPPSQTFIVAQADGWIAIPGNYVVDYCPDTNSASVNGLPMQGKLYRVESDGKFFIRISRARTRRSRRNGRVYRGTVNRVKIDSALFMKEVESAEQQILAILASDTRSENQCKSTV